MSVRVVKIDEQQILLRGILSTEGSAKFFWNFLAPFLENKKLFTS